VVEATSKGLGDAGWGKQDEGEVHPVSAILCAVSSTLALWGNLGRRAVAQIGS